MRGKRLAQRRKKMRDLAAADAANRCVWCKTSPAPFTRDRDGLKYCSIACMIDRETYLEMRAERQS